MTLVVPVRLAAFGRITQTTSREMTASSLLVASQCRPPPRRRGGGGEAPPPGMGGPGGRQAQAPPPLGGRAAARPLGGAGPRPAFHRRRRLFPPAHRPLSRGDAHPPCPPQAGT